MNSIAEKKRNRCPNCGSHLSSSFENNSLYNCIICNRSYSILINEKTSKTAFVENRTEPLFLPKGSIRALITISLTCVCLVLVLQQKLIPIFLQGLILSIIGYYFGFRKSNKEMKILNFNTEIKINNPLFLPNGFIRFFLVISYGYIFFNLLYNNKLYIMEYFDFVIIIIALFIGYFFQRYIIKDERSKAIELFNHVKGVVIIAALVILSIIVFQGDESQSYIISIICASIISFYFGSRT